jgi:hypothetical protein
MATPAYRRWSGSRSRLGCRRTGAGRRTASVWSWRGACWSQ